MSEEQIGSLVIVVVISEKCGQTLGGGREFPSYRLNLTKNKILKS